MHEGSGEQPADPEAAEAGKLGRGFGSMGSIESLTSLQSFMSVAAEMVVDPQVIKGALGLVVACTTSAGRTFASIRVLQGLGIPARRPYVKSYLSVDGRDVPATKMKTNVRKQAQLGGPVSGHPWPSTPPSHRLMPGADGAHLQF